MEQIEFLKTITDEDDDDILQAYLDNAEEIILNKLHPYMDDETEYTLPKKYKNLQCRIAAYFCNKSGADGQLSHVENGVSRHYGASDVPSDMLNEITPFAKVLI